MTKCVLPVQSEDLVHGIKHRAKRRDSAIHATHVLNSDEHSSCPSSSRPGESGVQHATHTLHVREGVVHARREAGGMHTVVHRDADGLVVEQGIVRLRHAREEVGVGVQAGVGRGG